MRKKFCSLILAAVMLLFGVFGLSGCVESLEEYKMTKQTELQAYADAKTEANSYSPWVLNMIRLAVTDGIAAISAAESKSAVLAALTDAKQTIDNAEENEARFKEYVLTKKAELNAYADAKGQENYSVYGWEEICYAVIFGKDDIQAAENEAQADAALNAAKAVIDAVENGRPDFILTIYIKNATANQGENFTVEVWLKNLSGADVSIYYYFAPTTPQIHNWRYPFPVYGLLPEPYVLIVKNNEVFHNTWTLGATGYFDPQTQKCSALPAGTHDLFFYASLPIGENGIFVWSNILTLTVK